MVYHKLDPEKKSKIHYQIAKLNKKQLLIDLVRSRLLFVDKRIKRLQDAPDITDQRLLHILETLIVMTPSANRLDEQTSAMIALKLANLSAKYGKSPYSPVAYAAYCYILFYFLKDPKKGKKLENITLELLQHSQHASAKSIAYCVLGSNSIIKKQHDFH